MKGLRACKSQGSIGMATLRTLHDAPDRDQGQLDRPVGIRVLDQRQPSSNLTL